MKSSERSKRVKKYIQLHGPFSKRKKESHKRKVRVRDEMLYILYEAGYSYGDIGFLQGMTRQRAEQLVKKGNLTRRGYQQGVLTSNSEGVK